MKSIKAGFLYRTHKKNTLMLIQLKINVAVKALIVVNFQLKNDSQKSIEIDRV